jgi:hypothetical protein
MLLLLFFYSVADCDTFLMSMLHSCKGREAVNLGLFEIHCGSSHKKPADYTWILDYEMTLKELILLVQVR